MSVGLMVGKFAPIHKGHQSVINLALEQNETVYLVLYNDPSFDIDYPTLTKDLRAAMIRSLYPDRERVKIVIGFYPPFDRPDELGDLIHAAYIKGLVNTRVNRVYGSEDYIYPMAEMLDAEPVLVDKERATIPVSATMLRNNEENARKYIDPRAWAIFQASRRME